MAGLCEGSNEPSGSLKASNKKKNSPQYVFSNSSHCCHYRRYGSYRYKFRDDDFGDVDDHDEFGDDDVGEDDDNNEEKEFEVYIIEFGDGDDFGDDDVRIEYNDSNILVNLKIITSSKNMSLEMIMMIGDDDCDEFTDDDNGFGDNNYDYKSGDDDYDGDEL
ncbi:hypothetical protein ANN_15952 [Periplaneta americana]|uniref:Uncharacterized protein n=1 Tax=Periplaneta americana TaxID=6978 RepID=A0ABQ8SJ03_PERAM|nr:hypothetical protein ANN_15952 [Periplaneta americana]